MNITYKITIKIVFLFSDPLSRKYYTGFLRNQCHCFKIHNGFCVLNVVQLLGNRHHRSSELVYSRTRIRKIGKQLHCSSVVTIRHYRVDGLTTVRYEDERRNTRIIHSDQNFVL